MDTVLGVIEVIIALGEMCFNKSSRASLKKQWQESGKPKVVLKEHNGMATPLALAGAGSRLGVMTIGRANQTITELGNSQASVLSPVQFFSFLALCIMMWPAGKIS